MRILQRLLFSFLFFIGLGLLDVFVISPLILPKDYCYYHFHETPWWVELFYMNPSSNGHPEGSLFHLIFLLIVSIALGFITAYRLQQKRKNKTQI